MNNAFFQVFEICDPPSAALPPRALAVPGDWFQTLGQTHVAWRSSRVSWLTHTPNPRGVDVIWSLKGFLRWGLFFVLTRLLVPPPIVVISLLEVV